MDNISEKELFEMMPVPKAVMTLAIPTIISQIVAIIYNLADTFFIGQLGDPYMISAVTLVYPWLNMLTALANLFGIGGSSLISRLMGSNRHHDVKYVSCFSFYCSLLTALIFSAVSFAFQRPILSFLGASKDNMIYAQSYLKWVVVFGGIPTMLSMTMAHLLRSEGHAKQASAGMMFGGILNMILDPVLIFGFKMGFVGAAVATAFSNTVSMAFFIFIFCKLKTSMSLNPIYTYFRFAVPVFSVGLASALATALATVSNMVIVKLAASYGDIPVAAYGIVKKIDMLPLGISMGLCQGFMPLVGYNYAAKNYIRMRKVSVFSWKTAMFISTGFAICFFVFAHWIMYGFIRDGGTVELGSRFLRIACLAVPLTSVNALIIYTLQAMGKGIQSAVLTACRQGLLNIPLLLMMNIFFGLYGMIWTQLVIEAVMLPVTFGMYTVIMRKLHREESENRVVNAESLASTYK